MQTKPENDLSTRERVYQCIVELTNVHRAASRNRIRELTGLPFGIVDEHVRQLKNSNKLRTLENGCYELVMEFPPDEAMSVTHLPSGAVLVEKGETVMTCTPSEARTLGKMLTGYGQELAQLYVQQNTEVRIARLENQLREEAGWRKNVSKRLAHLRRAARDQEQQPLF